MAVQTQETIVAEIPIQEKRGGSKLPLILAVLVLLALLAWWLTRNRHDDTARTDTAAAVAPADTIGGTGTAPRSDTALAPSGGTAPGTTTGTGTGTTGTGTGTGTATGTGTSTRP